MGPTFPSVLSDRFRDVDELGAGLSGTNYRATDPSSGRTGVLKLVETAQSWTPTERGRLVRELEKLAHVRSGYLPEIYASGIVDDVPWVFRAEVEADSLRDRLAAGPLEPALALSIATQLATALDEIHRAGLLQRDLSPERILVRADGSIALLGTSIAGRLATTSLFEVYGRPGYVSPEAVGGKLISFRSDLYSLGCVLFEMLSGSPPFTGLSVDAILSAHVSSATPALQASPVVAGLVQQLLQKEPRERPFSAQQVRRVLEPLVGSIPNGVAHEAREASSAGGIAVPPAPVSSASAPVSKVPPPPPGRSSLPPPPPADARKPQRVPTVLGMPAVRADGSPSGQVALPPSGQVALPPSPPSGRPPTGPTALPPSGQVALPPSPPSGRPPTGPTALPPSPPSGRPPTGPTALPPSGQVALGSGQAAMPPSGHAPLPDFDEMAETQAVSRDIVNELRAVGGLEPIAPAQPSPFGGPSQSPPAQSGAPAAFGTSPTPFGAQPAPFGAQPAPFGAQPAPFGAQPAPFGAQPSASTLPPVSSSPAAQPPRRRGVWVVAGLIGMCGLSSLGLAAGSWLFNVGNIQERLGAAPPRVATPVPAMRPTETAVPTPAEVAAPSEAAPSEAPAAPQPVAEAPTPTPPTPTPAAAPPPVPPTQSARAEETPRGAEGTRSLPVGATPTPRATPAGSEPTEPAGTWYAGALPAGGTRGTSAPTAPAPVAAATPPPSTGSSRLATGLRPSTSPPNAAAPAAPAPSDLEALRAEARAHFQAQRFREAESAYERASRLAPTNPGIWAGLGASRIAGRNPRGAVTAYRRAVQLSPTSAPFHASLGRALAESGDAAGARREYERALQLDPQNRDAQIGLSRL